MKIGIIGNYGATNTGDDAILSSILSQHSGHEFTVFSADPEQTKDQFGVSTAPLFPLGARSLAKHGFGRSLKALKSVDMVILGGGGLFQDDRLYACFLWAWQLFWVRLFNKPLFVYAAGVGPLKTKIGRKLTNWALSRAQVITVRDAHSKKLLRDIGLTEGEIHVTADPAVLFRLSRYDVERKKNLYILSLRPWLAYNKKIVDTFTDFLLKLRQEKNARFLFVAMQGIREHDYRILKPLMKRVGGEIYTPKNFTELLQVMRGCEFAIGMRFHFLIAALITETPVLPISYSPKVDELFMETPLERYLTPVAELSTDRLAVTLRRLSVDYNNVMVYEKRLAGNFNEKARKNTELFSQFMADLKE